MGLVDDVGERPALHGSKTIVRAVIGVQVQVGEIHEGVRRFRSCLTGFAQHFHASMADAVSLRDVATFRNASHAIMSFGRCSR